MNKIIILIIFSLFVCGFASAQPSLAELDKVKEIKLLESNRDDVRRIFAGYKFENNNLSDYRKWVDAPHARIEFSYSEGKCNDEDPQGYDVSEWKVDYARISLKTALKLKDIENALIGFGAELSTYKKEKLYVNDDDIYTFHNKELGIGLEVNKGKVQAITFIAPKRYYSLICDRKIAKRLSSTKSFFTRPLKDRRIAFGEQPFAQLADLILSLVKITADCPLTNSTENKVCSDNARAIEVSAVTNDPENDNLTFNYTVTGGKVIGTGSKVVWDLSGVKPGTYTITAGVDDGCGICGKTITKTVTVTECPDCVRNAPFETF